MLVSTHHIIYVACPLGIRPYNVDVQEGRRSYEDINSKYCVYFSDYGNYSYKQSIFILFRNIYSKHGNEWVKIFSDFYKNHVVLDISQYE